MHEGHVAVARGIIEAGMADEVWVTPCRQNPLKEEGSVMPDELRLSLLRKALEYANAGYESPKIKLCVKELTMPAPSFTADTMRTLMEENPDVIFRLAVGADSYREFEKWKDREWLERNFAPIVYPRPGSHLGEFRKGWTLLKGMKEYNVSSSAIREMMRKGETAEKFMPWIK